MIITSNGLTHEFTVSEVLEEIDTNCILNINRRREHLLYKKKCLSNFVNIGYVASDIADDLTVSVSVSDKSDLLAENRVSLNGDYIVIENITNYSIKTDQFLLTDTFSPALGSTTPIPLFYKHIIDTNVIPRTSERDLEIQSNYKLLTVNLLDSSFQPLSIQEISIDYDQGIIYNNLSSSFEISDSSYSVYYVQYSIKVGTDIFTYLDLLDNEDVYKVAEFEDLSETLAILPDRKVYLIEDTDNDFYITLPVLGDYAFKEVVLNKLKIIKPLSFDIQDPWFLFVSNSTIYGKAAGTIYKYYLAEFANQTWIPAYPYKKIINESSIILSKNLIKLQQSNILDNTDENLVIDLLINDSSGTGIAAFTTDPTQEGILADNDQFYVLWNTVAQAGIRSIDKKLGILDIDGLNLETDYEIISSYFYKENNYQFSSIDINPLNNPSILEQTLILFIDPDSASTTKSQTLYYLIVDVSGKVIQSNWYLFDNDSESIDGDELFYKSIPSYLEDEVSENAHIFLDEYSILGDGSSLVLGEVFVRETLQPNLLISKDSRQRGGGVKQTLIDSAKEKQFETSWFWDLGFWDGTPYPGHATFYVEVPVSIMDGAGGIFTANEIKSVVDRHIATGVYPIIKAYGWDPITTSIIPSANSISIEWRSFPGVLWNIYYSLIENGPWTLATVSPLADVETNAYSITGLLPGTIYSVLIVGGYLDEESDWIPLGGQPIGPNSLSAIGIINPNSISTLTFAPRTVTTNGLGHQFSVV